METVPSQRVSRSPRCARCRNHGCVVALKGHAGRCRFSQCSCWKCSLITERTRIMARQRGIRKRQRAEEHERGAGETGNRIGASSVSGVTESPARGAETEEKTYTELQAPEPAASSAWAPPNTDPEIPQKSSDHCKAAQDGSMLMGEVLKQPCLPWEYFLRGIPQNPGYSGDLAMAMPFHLPTHYTSTYAAPAFLVSFGVPPFGAIGLPHIPYTTLMESRQEDPGFFYMPYHLHEKPDDYQQYIRERADGADVSPPQHGGDSSTSD